MLGFVDLFPKYMNIVLFGLSFNLFLVFVLFNFSPALSNSHSKLQPMHSRFCCLLAQMLWGFSIFCIFRCWCSKWSAMVPRLTPVAFNMLLSVVVIRHCLIPQTDVYSLGIWTFNLPYQMLFLGLKIFHLCSFYSCFDFYYNNYECKWNHIVVSPVYCVL